MFSTFLLYLSITSPFVLSFKFTSIRTRHSKLYALDPTSLGDLRIIDNEIDKLVDNIHGLKKKKSDLLSNIKGLKLSNGTYDHNQDDKDFAKFSTRGAYYLQKRRTKATGSNR